VKNRCGPAAVARYKSRKKTTVLHWMGRYSKQNDPGSRRPACKKEIVV